jgi:hypothetical protein
MDPTHLTKAKEKEEAPDFSYLNMKTVTTQRSSYMMTRDGLQHQASNVNARKKGPNSNSSLFEEDYEDEEDLDDELLYKKIGK